MSTRKRPLTEVTNPSSTAQTPRRYTPSTPHAIRALQQRSGAKTRSQRARKFVPEEVDPASARGVLRRLAKITAPSTRPLRTPSTAGKENVQPRSEDEAEDRHLEKRPRMTFDIDESIEESMEEDPPQYEEEDSDLPAAPTPSVLPDDEHDPTITFQSIDFAKDGTRGKSRLSMPPVEGALDDDATMLTERGRRAFTEDATERLSRYSFGSIRMSDFGSELEHPRGPEAMKARLSEANSEMRRKTLDRETLLDETEDLTHLARRSTIDEADLNNYEPEVGNGDFQLDMPLDDEASAAASKQLQDGFLQPQEDGWEDIEEDAVDGEPARLSPSSKRRLTELQLASARQESGRRRKRVKMTKHGTLVPLLPTSLIKKIATEVQVRNGRRKPAFGSEHTKALEQATEWFFEQAGEDLAAYSSHGRRKRRIDTSDVLLMMKRQRVLQPGQLRKLAREWLPKDVRSSLELPDDL